MIELKFEKLIIWQKCMDYGFAIRSLAEVVTCLHKAFRRNYNSEEEFWECYRCFNVACQSQDLCNTMCYLIGDITGRVISPLSAPWCQVSIASACVYISLAY